MKRDDRGAATLLVIVMMTLIGTVAGVVAAVSGAVAAHRSAQASADLAAVSAAAVWVRGGDGCQEAARVAAANSSELTRCVMRGSTVEVTVQVPLSAMVSVVSGQSHAQATATGGPVEGWS